MSKEALDNASLTKEELEICNKLRIFLEGIQVFITTERQKKIHFRMTTDNRKNITEEALEDRDRFLFYWEEIKKEANREISFEELLFKSYAALLSEKGISDQTLINFENIIPKLQLSNYLATLSAKGYNTALQPFKQLNENQVGLQVIDNNFLNEIEYLDGNLVFKNNKYELVTLKNAVFSNEIQKFDLPLLRGLYSVIYQSKPIILGNTVSIKANVLAKYLGVNIRGDKGYAILTKLRQFDRLFGIMPDGSIYRVLTFSSYNKVTDVITLDSGFINELIRKSSTEYTKIRKRKGEKIEYIAPHNSFLIHSNIIKEKNKNAVLIVEQLIILLQQGLQEMTIDKITKKPIPVMQHISFKTLINRIPTFKDSIDRANSTTDKNKLLKRVFTKAYELLKTRTDAYKYYIDLEVTEIVPTVSLLKGKIELKHMGKNKEFNNENM